MTWWLLTFARGGPARYLSHLDTARALQRTFARAGVGLALSQGMRPKACLALPLPLPVGAAGCCEIATVEVVDGGLEPAAALAKLRAAAPPGIEPQAVAVVGERHPRPQPQRAEYTCCVLGDAGAVAAAVARFATEPQVAYQRVSPKGERALDLKEYVVDTSVEPIAGGAQLHFTIRHRPNGAARPQEYVDLIAKWAGIEPVMRGLSRERVTWTELPWAPAMWAEGVNPCDKAQEGDSR